jgi:hypothetical protein
MSLREWRLRRVIALGVIWMLVVLAVLAAGTTLRAREYYREHPADQDVYFVMMHLPGGLWTLFGPPVLLTVAWLVMRRSRPAS